MRSDTVLLFILGTVILGIAIAVGISLYEVQEKRLKEEELKRKNQESSLQINTVPQTRQQYYNASDFGLFGVRGKVVKFMPADKFIEALPLEDRKSMDYWIHIEQESGEIKVIKTTYETWLNLYPGDILR